jgi:hypothetical protein
MNTKTLLLAIIVGMFSLPATAADPEVRSIVPQGVQAGTTTTITFSGARLGDAHQLLFFDPGITVSDYKTVDGNSFSANVTVPPNFPSDLQAFRVATKTGISNLRLLGIGNLPITDEVEPNSDFESPQPIEPSHTIHGVVTPEDVDYFAIDLDADQTLTVELEGVRLAYMQNFFDPALTIYNAERFEVASSDDAPLLQQDCVCSFTTKEAGRFVIEVRESSFGGSNESRYRLHVGNFPRPLALYPPGGPAGQPLSVTCIGPQGNTFEQSFALPSEPDGAFRVWAALNDQVSPSPNRIRVSKFGNVLESDDNDNPNQVAIQPTLPIAFNGIIESEGDVDWFGFSAKKDQQIEVRLIGRNVIRSPVDGVLMIRKVGGGQLTANDDSGSPDGFINFKVPEDGDYVVGVKDHLNRFGPHNVYRIEMTLPDPELTVKIKEQRRWISQPIAIPRGSRMAIHADLVRRFVGGEATIEPIGLPPGVTLSSHTVDKDRTETPLIFEAALDAPLAGALVELRPELQLTPESKINGQLEQRSQIIRGQNNRDVWGHDSNRLGLAVVDEVPFDIVVEQPAAPLVRNGSLQLKVTATRKGDFKGQIALRLLYTPPGVGASGSIKIEPDATEAYIPLTANGNASLRQWPITVLAMSNIAGRTEVASKLVTLDVADSLFDFQFAKAATEQGKPVDFVVTVSPKQELPGAAQIELLGIPPGTTCPESKIDFKPDSTEADGQKLAFRINVPADARVGSFKTLVCRATVANGGGTITQTNGTGEVQIDKPLPAPVAVAQAAPTAKPEAAPAEAKPLSRLEKLRQQKANSDK